jgi:LacI family transcriptional regulator
MRVAVLVETSNAYGRDIQAGIAEYAKRHGDWSIYVEQHELGAPPPAWLMRQRWDGIISRPTTPTLARAFRRVQVPVVDLNDQHDDLGFPRLISDDAGIGRQAAAHLKECGVAQLAYCGFTAEPWAAARRDGFLVAANLKRSAAICFETRWRGRGVLPWSVEQSRLAVWLTSLPKPVGIFACNDVRARHVLEAARRLNLRVPTAVSVIGVDNDELLCQMCDPPLSSVLPDATGIGFLAGRWLDRLMNGRTLSTPFQQLPPRRVVPRQSTRVRSVEDEHLSTALQIIRGRACRGLRVNDVLREVPASRSWLDRRFRQVIGHTPREEIRNVQLQQAAILLETTDLPLKQIAAQCGLTHI